MLLDHFRHLQTENGMPFDKALILKGAEEWPTLILITVLTTGPALLPLVLAGNRPENEIKCPIDFLIVRGLFAAKILTLMLMPSLFHQVGTFQWSKCE